ncbi:hypothetical protein BT63DRAFT_423714 [Microthyrium microscopicum]|uniref:Uncharacterized protein n=1 Tax=Microthyrium microscopicum TaxID=703497 RepID=A0A6A6UJ60_9PEZI|nr:hypothetical protein BT63DRAFT_423714 [Microthyrium microscopicum]
MSVNRTQLPQDPFQRPATVGYTGQAAGATFPQQQPQQWAPQQPTTGYNPAQYPVMPSVAGQYQGHVQPQQQQQSQYNQQQPVYQTPGSQAPPAPGAYQAENQNQGYNNRWSVSGQVPNQTQQYDQNAPQRQSIYVGGSGATQNPIEGQSQYAQQVPPPLPPKDGYAQHAMQTQQYGAQQPQTAAGYQQPNQQFAPPQGQYQYAGQQPQQYGQPQQVPPPTQSPLQNFHNTPPPQAQYGHQPQPSQPANQYQSHGQQIGQAAVPNQQYQQPGQHPQPGYQGYQQQQYHQTYPPQQQPGQISNIPLQSSQNPQVEPVSPILAGRQNDLQNSRPSSHHLPSRTNSNISKPILTPNSNSSPPRPARTTDSPISALKPVHGQGFETKKKVADPNGVGSTGASALGYGGPSDWESFGPAEYEVDDLDFYSQRQEKAEEQKDAPIELPTGSPVTTGPPPPTSVIHGVMEVEGSTVPVQQHPIHAPQQSASVVGAAIDSGVIMSAEPRQAHSNHPPGPPPNHPQVASPPPAENGLIISNASGWVPPPSTGAQYQQPPSQPHTGIIVGAAGSQAGWQGAPIQGMQMSNVPPQQPASAPPGQMHVAPPHTGLLAQTSLAHSIPNTDEHKALLAKLAETESELAHFKDREMETRLLGEQSTEEVQKLNGRIAKLQDECNGAQSEYAKLERSMEAMENASVTASNEKAAMEKERGNLIARIQQLESALATMNAEKEGTRGDLTTKLQAAETAHATTRTDAEAASTGYQAKIKEHETSLAEAKSEIEVLKKQLEDAKSKPADIAPGLGDWYKGSLSRFSEVLFAEEAADSVPIKMKKFQDWVNAEAQMRGIQMEFRPKSGFSSAQEPLVSPAFTPADTPTHKPSLDMQAVQRAVSNADSDGEQYSPGGRPIIGRPVAGSRTESEPAFPVQQPIIAQMAPAIPAETNSPTTEKQPFRAYRDRSSSNAVVHPPRNDSRSSSIPNNAGQSVQVPVQPPVVQAAVPPPVAKPAYQKFQYVPPTSPNAGVPIVESITSPVTLTRNSASLPLLPTSARSASVRPQEETFLPSVAEGSKVPETPIDESALPAPLKPKTPAPFTKSPAQEKSPAPKILTPIQDKKKKSSTSPIEELLDILPPFRMPTPLLHHPLIIPIHKATSRFSPSDFSFIRAVSSEWEARAASNRKRLDSERAKRQAAFEKDPDQLFQDGEIGYGDISAIEEEHKNQELKHRDQEDTEEWESYNKEVFSIVFGRLQAEIEELLRIRADVDALVSAAVAGAEALGPVESAKTVPLVDALDLLIRVHGLLEERESEANAAVIERDRRFKKGTTRGLYRRGQIKALKEREAHFEKLERRNLVDQRVKRTKNCAELMKNVETTSTRGCDKNEACARQILALLKRIAEDSSSPDVGDALGRSADVLVQLADSSTRLMRLFGKVDSLLNDAEYGQQVAIDKLNDMGPEVFKDLEGDKKEHDVLLKQDANKREAGVQTALKEWQAELDKTKKSLGSGGDAGASADGDDEEREKKKRLQAALENAKRRNRDL